VTIPDADATQLTIINDGGHERRCASEADQRKACPGAPVGPSARRRRAAGSVRASCVHSARAGAFDRSRTGICYPLHPPSRGLGVGPRADRGCVGCAVLRRCPTGAARHDLDPEVGRAAKVVRDSRHHFSSFARRDRRAFAREADRAAPHPADARGAASVRCPRMFLAGCARCPGAVSGQAGLRPHVRRPRRVCLM
jgi:hypothetical protein